MIFTAAINQICDGQKVTRKEWNNKKEYCLLLNDVLMIHTKKKLHSWIVSYADMLAEDWVILDV